MWRAVKGVFGGGEKENAIKENDEKVKSKRVVEKGGEGSSNVHVQDGGKGDKTRYISGGELAGKGEESGIIRTEVDLPLLVSNSQKKLAFLLDNVCDHQ